MLGSHNSVSYLPIKGWKKFFKPWIKCQSLTLQEQWNKGVRYFDLRIRKYKDEGWWYCHNTAIFAPVMESKELLEFLMEKKAYVRIMLDVRVKPKDADFYKEDFLELVDWLKDQGLQVDSTIVYWEWKEYSDRKIQQNEYHSSVSAPWYKYILGTKWFAKHYNKKQKDSIAIKDSNKVLMLDYIQL